MLRAFFVGNESLFRGLAVPPNHNWNGYSVIYFNFGRSNIESPKKFLIDLSGTVIRTGKSYGIKVEKRRHFEFQLRELILDLADGKPESVVVLIDDYDRPVRRNMERGRNHVAKTLSDSLEDFFELLKSLVESLKLVVVTGIANMQLMKFSSVVSNFCDITADPDFGAIMGFTHQELIDNFSDHLMAMADQHRDTFKNITEAIKRMYHSYCFTCLDPERRIPILNPGSINSCLEFKKIDNYWYNTPSRLPDYIIKYFRENRLTSKYFHNSKVLRKTLEKKYDFNREIPMEVFLILHGYLTYRGYDAETELFTVDFPNKEVEETFLDQVVEHDPRLAQMPETARGTCTSLKTALVAGNTEAFIHYADLLLKKKTKPITQAITEEYPLTSLMESVLRASAIELECGLTMYHEDSSSNLGEIDVETLNLPTNYVMEFKWRRTAAVAINQLLRYSNTTVFQEKFKNRAINLLGINFYIDRSWSEVRLRYRPVTMNDWIKVRYHDGVCSELEASHPRYLLMYENLTLPGTLCNTFKSYDKS